MIEKISFYQLSLPLKEPYHLSFKDLHHFDTFITVIQDNGLTGVGETTPLPGYSNENPHQVWAFGKEIGPQIIGRDIETAREVLNRYIKTVPFAVTPFLTAMESLEEKNGLVFQDMELAGILSTSDHEQILRQFPDIISKGFNTVKVKVGKDVDADIAKVNLIQSLRPEGVRIRIDANQGYDYDRAVKFVKGVNPDGIELFEQPFPKNVWDDMKRLSRISPIPLMLDESINTEDDLMRTIELKCASYVKFKLMKAGSLSNLARLIKAARQSGLKIVLGNGVAGEIGCYHEAIVSSRTGLTSAGEMNGFLKLKESVLVKPIIFDSGKIKGGTVFLPQLDYGQLKKYLVKDAFWEY